MNNMIEVNALNEDQFLKVAETLTRIGMTKRRQGQKTKLYQTAYIYHKKGRYYLAHFKTLYELDGAPDNELTTEDKKRLNNIVLLLTEWGLVEPIDKLDDFDPDVKLVVVKHIVKAEFDLVQPYKIGGKHG